MRPTPLASAALLLFEVAIDICHAERLQVKAGGLAMPLDRVESLLPSVMPAFGAIAAMARVVDMLSGVESR